MPGRRLPTRRGNAVVGGDSPTLQGYLLLTESGLNYEVTEGEYFASPSGAFLLVNTGPGNWNNPQYSISYSGAEDWLSFSTGTNGEQIEFIVQIEAGALTPSAQTATVTFTDSNVSNSGVQLTITVDVVAAAPIIGVSSLTVPISIVDETASGTVVSLTVSNTGGSGALALPTAGTITGTGAAYIADVDFSGSAGGPYTMDITPTATGGTPGTYQAVIPVQSSGALNSPVDVTVNVTVVASQTAIIALSRTLDDAQYVLGGTGPTAQSVTYFNAGTGSFAGVTIQNVAYTGDFSGWGSASLVDGEVRVAIDVSGILTDGTSKCVVTLADANAAATTDYTVFLRTSQAVLSPLLSVAPSAIPHASFNGANATDRTITIQNVNGSIAQLGTLSVTVSAGVTWCTVASVVGGTATLSFPSSALADGNYSATITVAASAAANSPVSVPVTLTVSPVLAAPMLAYPLPAGLTQNATTGYIEGTVTGVARDRPAHWNSGSATHTVTTPTEFATALAASASQNNPIIEIPAGTTLSGGNFRWTLPVRSGSGVCVIRTGGYASLPAAGTRINPTTHAAHIAWLNATGTLECLGTANAAANYCFIGIGSTDSGWASRPANSILDDQFLQWRIGPQTANLANTASNFSLHQCIGLGHPAGASNRWMNVRCTNFIMRDCYGDDYKSVNRDAQVVLVQDSGSFHQYENSSFNAAGEPWMTAGSALPFNNKAYECNDIYFKQCLFYNKWEWFPWHPTFVVPDPTRPGLTWGTKNLWETKRGFRILVDGCVLHTGGIEGQAGMCLVIKSTNNNTNNPTASVSQSGDVQVIHTYGYNCQRAVTVQGNSSQAEGGLPTERVHVLDVLFDLLNVPPNNGAGYALEVTSRSRDVIIEGLTLALNGGNSPQGAILADRTFNPIFRRMIIPKGQYGVFGQNAAEGVPSMNFHWVNYTWDRNVLYKGSNSNNVTNYPPTTYIANSEAAVGFAQPGTQGPLSMGLSSSSPYAALWNNGEPLGCNVQRLEYRIRGVEAGTPVNS